MSCSRKFPFWSTCSFCLHKDKAVPTPHWMQCYGIPRQCCWPGESRNCSSWRQQEFGGVGRVSWLPSFNYPWALSHFWNQVTGLERPFGLTQCCCLDVNADNDSLTLIPSGPRVQIEGTICIPAHWYCFRRMLLLALSFSETDECRLITTAPILKNGESYTLLMSLWLLGVW